MKNLDVKPLCENSVVVTEQKTVKISKSNNTPLYQGIKVLRKFSKSSKLRFVLQGCYMWNMAKLSISSFSMLINPNFSIILTLTNKSLQTHSILSQVSQVQYKSVLKFTVQFDSYLAYNS